MITLPAAIGDLDYIDVVDYSLLGCQSAYGGSEQLPYVDLQESSQYNLFLDSYGGYSYEGINSLDAKLTGINNRLQFVDELAFDLCDPQFDFINQCQFRSVQTSDGVYMVDRPYADANEFSFDIIKSDQYSGINRLFAQVIFYDSYKANGQYVQYDDYGFEQERLSWSKGAISGNSIIELSSSSDYLEVRENANCTGEIASDQSDLGFYEQLQSYWTYDPDLLIDVHVGPSCLGAVRTDCSSYYY